MDDPDRTRHRPSLFVSYAHEDKQIVAGLRKFFIPLERRFRCQLLWDDSLIRAGDDWLGQIEQAIDQARFAVLLMSADFLASEFIHDRELPRLLDRSRRGELKVLPMLVSPIDLSISGVDQLQFVNPPELPLGGMSDFEQQAWYLKVAKYVRELIEQGPQAADDGPAAAALAAAGMSPPALPPTTPDTPATATGGDGAGVGDDADAQTDDGEPPVPRWTDTASFSAIVPPRVALAEIENQLLRLKAYTREVGFAVFECDGYYVQFDYRPTLDDRAVLMEVQSNAYLQNGRRLGALQMRHLTRRLRFRQADPCENLLRYAPLNSERDMEALARLSWEVLTEVYPSLDDAPLVIHAQCC
ncbi:toll/interleukin-1 receptor domain-containing protein [Ideonella sp. DXS22W]|uniref:Toll/interleukin-1 receptor domain-containing protein n=1 Tax=Pseudaquabacterium inlustre TaxID=2984192 RepID=A0ABU9CGL1_9BURK